MRACVFLKAIKCLYHFWGCETRPGRKVLPVLPQGVRPENASFIFPVYKEGIPDVSLHNEIWSDADNGGWVVRSATYLLNEVYRVGSMQA
jgi:hypothetical protein